MDSDCLIKFTKVGSKDLVVNNDSIFIPKIVQKEAVDSGKDKGLPDALIKVINKEFAFLSLKNLYEYISEDEYSTVKLLMEKIK